MVDLARLKKIYGQFAKDRLVPVSEYVDFDEIRGESVLAPLKNRFILTPAEETCAQLFSGGRGSGKTTELRRFRDQLKRAGFTALYLDVEDTIDVNTCGFADYLFAIAYGVRKAVETGEVRGDSRLKNYLADKVDEIHRTLGARLRVPGLDLKLSASGIEAGSTISLERALSSREALNDEFEALASDATREVREMLKRLNDSVRKGGSHGLVLLVDGADKISPYPPSDGETEQHVRIFAHRATYLTRLGCHVVYSVPLSFCYSPHAQTFTRTAGVEGPIILPNTSLDAENTRPDGTVVSGRTLFVDMVTKRLNTVGEQTAAVFDQDALDLAITESGGNPDSLANIILSAIIRGTDELPIAKLAVDRAVKEMANTMAMQVPDECWEVLNALKRRHSYPNKSDEAFRTGLYHHYIYQYANGEPQFEVNPVLRRLKRLDG